jgi:nucleotide-binding universal stress UspA family protein
MAFKDILVYAQATERGLARLHLAAEMAAHQGARLTALYVLTNTPEQRAQHKTAEYGLVPGNELAKLDESFELSNKAEAETVHAQVKTLQAQRDIPIIWSCVTGSPAEIVAERARTADICVLGQEAAGELSSGYSFAEGMLFVTGRPILLVPAEGIFTRVGRHVVIAWNGSRPAARAVSDALPLLQHTDRATLLTINAPKFLNRSGGTTTDAMEAHLLRHGVPIDVRHLDAPPGAIAETLQLAALEMGADLLIAGAYGHPKLWEKFLGGVTRNLLEHMRLPIMLSH